jgi:thiol-disulfide isomerase/thioredoxin
VDVSIKREDFMFSYRNRKSFVRAVTAFVIVLAAGVALAQQMNQSASNPYLPPEKASPTQLKAHIEKMQRVGPAARQAGYGEAMVTASTAILESKPPESLRAFAAVSLMDGLHEWADAEHNATADERLAEEAKKYLGDSDKKVATTAAFYNLEERVLKPGDIAPGDVLKVLDDVKSALTGRTLNAAKYTRIANGTATLINYLGSDEEAENQFKQFGRLLETSVDPALARLGTQLKVSKRDAKLAVPPDKAANNSADNGAIQAAGNRETTQPATPEVETAEQWLDRVEGHLPALTGSAHDAEYENQKAAFLKQYPQDPLRWRWNLMDARRAMGGAKNREQGSKAAKAALSAVMAADDATAETREKASTMNLQLDIFNHVPIEELAKEYAEYAKAFPKSPARGALAQSIVEMASGGEINEGAVARLRDLKGKSDGLLAAIVQVRIGELEKLLELKHNPMEMKFTDVDGHEFDLESYRGKVVLIDFWATWCGPCVAGLPEVIEQYKKYHDQGLEIVGISFDEDKTALQQFVKEKDMSWVQFFDGKGWENLYGKKYGIHAIPAMWLIGRDGKVVDFNARAGLPQKLFKLLESREGGGEATSASATKTPDKS